MRKAISLDNEEEFKLIVVALFKDFKEFNINANKFSKAAVSAQAIYTIWGSDAVKNTRYDVVRSIHLREDSEKVIQLCNLKLIPLELKLKFTKTDEQKDDEKPSAPILFTSDFTGERINQLLNNKDYVSVVGINKKSPKYKPAAWEVYKSAADVEGVYLYLPKYKDWLFISVLDVTEDTQCFVVLNKNHCVVLNEGVLTWGSTDNLFQDEADAYMLPVSPVLSEKEFTDSETLASLIATAKQLYIENQTDNFVIEGDLESEPLNFACGSEEQLNSMLTTVMHAGIPMYVWEETKTDEVILIISAATDDGAGAELNEESMSWQNNNWAHLTNGLTAEHKETIVTAITTCIEHNTPCGHTWEYNDGPYDRASAYDRSPINVDVSVYPPSAHEQIAAKQAIKGMKNIFSAKIVKNILNINSNTDKNEHIAGKTD